MKELYRIFGVLIAITVTPVLAEAGWFGPDNYEECVLDKMKGQDRGMLPTAEKACEKQFPFEKKLFRYQGNIDIDWTSDESWMYLDIKRNSGGYRVTRYMVTFTSNACDNVTSEADYTLTKTFYFDSGETTSAIEVDSTDSYRCMQTTAIWGIWSR